MKTREFLVRLLLASSALLASASALAQEKEPFFVDRKLVFADMFVWTGFEYGFDKSTGYYLFDYAT